MNIIGRIFCRHKGAITVGSVAPDFCLPSPQGKKVCLSDFRGKKTVVLYFYPKDNTPICTAESVMFRDHFSQFESHRSVILGISSDSPVSHEQFAAKFKLPFMLLSDSDNHVRELYQVPPALGLIPGRTTYVIDQQGIIQLSHTSQFKYDSHVVLALAKVKESQIPA